MVCGISSCCSTTSIRNVESRCQKGAGKMTTILNKGARTFISTSAANFGHHYYHGIYRTFHTLQEAGCASVFSPTTFAMTAVSAVDTLFENVLPYDRTLFAMSVRKAPGVISLAALSFPLCLTALEAAKYYAFYRVIDK